MMLIIAIIMTVINDNDDLNTTCRWDLHFLAYLLELYSYNGDGVTILMMVVII